MPYKNLIRPWLFRHDPEDIHNCVLSGLSRASKIPLLSQAIRHFCTVKSEALEQRIFGLTFPNPVGLAAGMDKMGVALRGFEMLGFGSIEMGGITALGQNGNEKPRVFRLPEDEALINRMGFNNGGAEQAEWLLGQTRLPDIPLGINIGKSKLTPVEDMDEVVGDYCYTFHRLYSYADFFVINVSSPNTPGLRGLQGKEFLKVLLKEIQRQNRNAPRKSGERLKPVLLKIAPDLSRTEIEEILSVVSQVGIDGIVAVNTTVKRDGLKTTGNTVKEIGGLSGKPIRERALEVVSFIHKENPCLPIIGVGGIFSGQDAYAMLKAGAVLIQILTGLVYEGPGLVRQINRELLQLMKQDGLNRLSDLHPVTACG